MAALGAARLREMAALQALRLANEGKLLAPGPEAEPRVCLCQKAPAAPMVQCELCRDAFHTGCVALPGPAPGPRPWLCPLCRRSEKPPLERILPLLASLQRLRVRLPEGDALRYMIERTVSWQHRAQQLLASGGLAPLPARPGPGLPHGRWPASETSKVSRPSPRWWAPSSASSGGFRGRGSWGLALPGPRRAVLLGSRGRDSAAVSRAGAGGVSVQVWGTGACLARVCVCVRVCAHVCTLCLFPVLLPALGEQPGPLPAVQGEAAAGSGAGRGRSAGPTAASLSLSGRRG